MAFRPDFVERALDVRISIRPSSGHFSSRFMWGRPRRALILFVSITNRRGRSRVGSQSTRGRVAPAAVRGVSLGSGGVRWTVGKLRAPLRFPPCDLRPRLLRFGAVVVGRLSGFKADESLMVVVVELANGPARDRGHEGEGCNQGLLVTHGCPSRRRRNSPAPVQSTRRCTPPRRVRRPGGNLGRHRDLCISAQDVGFRVHVRDLLLGPVVPWAVCTGARASELAPVG